MISLSNPSPATRGVDPAIRYFKIYADSFASAATRLQTTLREINGNQPATVLTARKALTDCRIRYKKIEFFLAYFFKSSSLIYNAPPKIEIEEPYMEYEEPVGLQVIEALLFEKRVGDKKDTLLQQADIIVSSAKDLHALLYRFQATDKQLLESIRQELIRVITLGITGFDAPLLKSGIVEASASLQTVQQILIPYLSSNTRQSDSVTKYLTGGLRFLQQHPDFDSFNRLTFLTQYMLPLQQQLGYLIKELNLQYNTTGGVLNYDAGNIFSVDALNIQSFPHAGDQPDSVLAKLGKKLFFEPGLSGNNKVSCATCHDPGKHFTDGLPTSLAFDGHNHLQRNATTLLYAGFQYEQFWDGRAKSLEEQARTVMSNPLEMNGGPTAIQSLLQRKPEYNTLLQQAFPQAYDTMAILNQVANTIAAYIRTLNPRNSRFDQYIQGKGAALTEAEVNGFNLFMGKAQCGTCHFAPLFNGLTPPLYNITELEVLGTTRTDDLDKPEPDTDPGRFNIFPMEGYQKAFKTPTVRNASATGPYMHNGAFKTLNAVVEFYNKGGAAGLGLPMNNQTLSSLPLNLTNKEINDIVQFLHALEDSVATYIPETK
jgi:cytochrome c peroxidase